MTTSALQFLDQIVTVRVDRPLGSRHPQWDSIYPVNYGYVPGTQAPDGDELDAYVLGVSDPVTTFTGRCTAVLHRLNDNDDKLILVPDGQHYTDDQIRAFVEFQERHFQSTLIRRAGMDG